MNKSGFYVTNRENLVGFRLCFLNGYEVSVVFGEDTGSSEPTIIENTTGTDYFCENAEIAVINNEGDLIPFVNKSAIKEHIKPEDILQVISWAANR